MLTVFSMGSVSLVECFNVCEFQWLIVDHCFNWFHHCIKEQDEVQYEIQYNVTLMCGSASYTMCLALTGGVRGPVSGVDGGCVWSCVWC